MGISMTLQFSKVNEFSRIPLRGRRYFYALEVFIRIAYTIFFCLGIIISISLDLHIKTIPVDTFHALVNYVTSIGFKSLSFSYHGENVLRDMY